MSSSNYENTWNNAQLDSNRIDKIITRINELTEGIEEDDTKFQSFLLLLPRLAGEIVSKLRGLKEDKIFAHKLYTESIKLLEDVGTVDVKTLHIDATKLLIKLLWYKQNMLKLGLRYEDEIDDENFFEVDQTKTVKKKGKKK